MSARHLLPRPFRRTTSSSSGGRSLSGNSSTSRTILPVSNHKNNGGRATSSSSTATCSTAAASSMSSAGASPMHPRVKAHVHNNGRVPPGSESKYRSTSYGHPTSTSSQGPLPSPSKHKNTSMQNIRSHTGQGQQQHDAVAAAEAAAASLLRSGSLDYDPNRGPYASLQHYLASVPTYLGQSMQSSSSSSVGNSNKSANASALGGGSAAMNASSAGGDGEASYRDAILSHLAAALSAAADRAAEVQLQAASRRRALLRGNGSVGGNGMFAVRKRAVMVPILVLILVGWFALGADGNNAGRGKRRRGGLHEARAEFEAGVPLSPSNKAIGERHQRTTSKMFSEGRNAAGGFGGGASTTFGDQLHRATLHNATRGNKKDTGLVGKLVKKQDGDDHDSDDEGTIVTTTRTG